MTADELASQYRKGFFVWPGGYALHAIMKDSGVVCRHCVEKERETILSARDDPQWEVLEFFVHWEGDDLYCDHCGERIAPEYED